MIVLIGISGLTHLYSIPSRLLPNETVWKSKSYQYNPSIANGVIAIRNSYYNRHSAFHMLKITVYNSLKRIVPFTTKDRFVLYHINDMNKLHPVYLDVGLEDPRIFYHTQKNEYYMLGTHSTKESIFPSLITLSPQLQILSNSPISSKGFPTPLRQKNWTFFTDAHQQVLLLTDVYPSLRIRTFDDKTYETNLMVEHNTSSFFALPKHLQMIRCSSNFVPWKNNTLLCALHVKYCITYRTLFITIEDQYPFRPLRHSDLFHLTGNAIEFASGLDWNEDRSRLLLSFGRDDYDGMIVSIRPDDIF